MLKLGRLEFLKSRNKASKKALIKVPSETKYIRKVSAKILRSLSACKLGESKAFDIKLCIEEAVRNAIVHGNHSDKRLSVKASCWMEDGKVNIEVEDEGSGFDHRFLADPTSSAHIMKNSGRGVYLIKKLMDKVEFNETGNKIRMITSIKQGG